MSILVDSLFDGRVYYKRDDDETQRTGARNKHMWCHMTSDVSEIELHYFASRIGLKRVWFQGDHYDLTPGRRRKAVELGAREVEAEDIVRACAKVWPGGRTGRVLRNLGR